MWEMSNRPAWKPENQGSCGIGPCALYEGGAQGALGSGRELRVCGMLTAHYLIPYLPLPPRSASFPSFLSAANLLQLSHGFLKLVTSFPVLGSDLGLGVFPQTLTLTEVQRFSLSWS